jgi:hypothetical protein
MEEYEMIRYEVSKTESNLKQVEEYKKEKGTLELGNVEMLQTIYNELKTMYNSMVGLVQPLRMNEDGSGVITYGLNVVEVLLSCTLDQFRCVLPESWSFDEVEDNTCEVIKYKLGLNNFEKYKANKGRLQLEGLEILRTMYHDLEMMCDPIGDVLFTLRKYGEDGEDLANELKAVDTLMNCAWMQLSKVLPDNLQFDRTVEVSA